MPFDRLLVAVVVAVSWMETDGQSAPGLDAPSISTPSLPLPIRDRVVAVPAGTCRIGSAESAANPPRQVTMPAYAMGRHETTVEEYCAYLNAADIAVETPHPQLDGDPGAYRPRWSQSRKPATHVPIAEAEAYCAWLSRQTDCVVRLPTEEEWEYAARSGLSGVRYPWGWGHPARRAAFDLRGSRRVGSYAPNRFGLFDMAGNVYEWCRSSDDPSRSGACTARGGSWAERAADYLAVYRSVPFPCAYRDADVGFRILVEIPGAAPGPDHASP